MTLASPTAFKVFCKATRSPEPTYFTATTTFVAADSMRRPTIVGPLNDSSAKSFTLAPPAAFATALMTPSTIRSFSDASISDLSMSNVTAASGSGALVGFAVGELVGAAEGAMLGEPVGALVETVGALVETVGNWVGAVDGELVGMPVVKISHLLSMQAAFAPQGFNE